MNHDKKPSLHLTWLGTAGFRVTAPHVDLIFDPYLSRLPGARPARRWGAEDFADAKNILLGHGHFDHAMDVPAILDTAPGCRVHGSAGVMRILAKHGVEPDRMTAFADGEVREIGGARVEAIPTHHTVFDAPLILRTLMRLRPGHLGRLWPLKDWPCGGPLSYHVEVEGFRLLHMSTCGPTDEELADLARAPVDLCLIPLQGHSRIEELALRVVQGIRPKAVLVHHQDDFAPPISQEIPLAPFLELMESELPSIPVHWMEMGETRVFETPREAAA